MVPTIISALPENIIPPQLLESLPTPKDKNNSDVTAVNEVDMDLMLALELQRKEDELEAQRQLKIAQQREHDNWTRQLENQTYLRSNKNQPYPSREELDRRQAEALQRQEFEAARRNRNRDTQVAQEIRRREQVNNQKNSGTSCILS
jgi:hypothetical protein